MKFFTMLGQLPRNQKITAALIWWVFVVGIMAGLVFVPLPITTYEE